MSFIVASVGLVAGLSLTGLLVLNLNVPALGLWPPRRSGWQVPVFWSLFRLANLAALLCAGLDWQPSAGPLRIVAAVVAATGGAFYLGACVSLGLVNLYGGTAGLNTAGLYDWSRNPQYALAMASYVALAVATWSFVTAMLVVLLVAVFVLMALAEEPWLEATYGEEYRLYRARVARFYSLRRLWGPGRLAAVGGDADVRTPEARD